MRVGACGMLAAAGSASATWGPSARLDIVAVPASVTHSTAALPTYASYRLTITSLDRDRLKKLGFKGTVAVQGLPPGSPTGVTLLGSEAATCSLTPAGALQCDVPGELSQRGRSVSFTVTLKAPSAGSALVLSGKALFFEHCCHWKQTHPASAATELLAPDPDAFSSFVPTPQTVPAALYSGTRTLTGVVGAIPVVDRNAVPPIDDPFTTTVVVPVGSAATTASVVEREIAQSCSANPRCFESRVTMPGRFDFLRIILRRDRTTLIADPRYNGQSAIDNAIVKYFPDDDPNDPDKFIILLNCSVVPGGVPTPKNPCIASRLAFPVPTGQPASSPTGLEGDWEFVIHALDNGRYTN
jgi:hypothetical protein